MNAFQIVIYSMLVIMIIGVGYTYYKKYKKSTPEDINKLILSNISEITDIIKTAVEALQLDRDKFENEEEYNEALANIVLEDFKEFLSKYDSIPSSMIDKITKENIEDIIQVVSNFIPKRTSKTPQINIDEPVEDILIDKNKTNISNNLNDFYNQ